MKKLAKLIQMSSKIGALVGMCWMVSVPAIAQGVITGPSQTGVIQAKSGSGDGLALIISNVEYKYDGDITVFTIRGTEVSDADLTVGMVVRFTIEDGVLDRVEVLGPNNLIEDFDEH